MSEESDTTVEAAEATDTDSLGDAGKRALDAERKARATAEKALRDAEARLKAVDDADKSEVEKLTAQVAELSKTAEAATARADRFEVAAAKGLSLAQARRLVGTTKEELEQDAAEMRAELGLDKVEGKKQSGRPKEDLKLGASNEESEEVDPKKLADSILSSAW